MTRRTGHIRLRGKGTYELRYSLGANPASGKRKIVTATVHGSQKEAEAELRKRLREKDIGMHVDPTRMTVGQWLSDWLAARRDSLSQKSHERYGEIIANFLEPELGALRIAKLAPAHIQAAYSKWGQQGGRRDGKEGGLSPATRRYIHRIFRAALSGAVDQQIIARNPSDVFRNRLPKIERKEMATLNPEQSARLVAALEGSRLQLPVLLALATGMRRGEICALRWKNVDLARGEIRVLESLEQTGSGLRFKAPKTDKSRVILLPAFIVERARKAKIAQAEELLRVQIRQTSEMLVCCQADGSPYQPRSLTHAFTREVARVRDIPRVRFHDLRHSHATMLLLAGVHPKVAQERMGHSSVSTTLDLYSHVTATMQQDAADRLDGALGHAISGALGGK